MAVIPSSSTLPFSNPNPFPFSSSSSSSPSISTPIKLNAQTRLPFTIPRASSDDSDDAEVTEAKSSDPDFESRLSQVRVRYKSGKGKKAEVRKARKGGKGASSSSSGSGSSMYLPSVQLKEPVSEGLNVEFGFSPYSERVNGRIAILGLTGLILVELATGQSVINYHSPAIVLIQLYFMAAASALYIKYEKERISVWPQTPSVPSPPPPPPQK